MGLYGRSIYPHVTDLMNRLVGSHPRNVEVIMGLAEELKGTVLEIGIGTGGCLPLYDPVKVKKVYGLDPHPGMIEMSRAAAEEVPVEVEFLNEPAEEISFPDHSVETVFSTFTFCTIPDLPRALAEMRRVLSRDGRMVFIEHGLSPDRWVRYWQHVEEPLHRWVFQGCNLTRRIPGAIEAAGFEIVEMRTEYIRRCPKAWGYTWRGVAEPSVGGSGRHQ